MLQEAQIIEDTLAQAKATEQEALRDPRLSDYGRGEKIQQAWTTAKQTARDLAERFVEQAGAQLAQAEHALTELEVASAGAIDQNRLAVAHTESQTLAQTATSYADVERKVEAAIKQKDTARLQSLRDIAIPLALQRARQDFSPFADHRGELVNLQRTIDDSLQGLAPEPLKQARTQYQTAQQRHAELVDALQSVDFRYSTKHGGPSLFAPRPAVFVSDFNQVKVRTR